MNASVRERASARAEERVHVRGWGRSAGRIGHSRRAAWPMAAVVCGLLLALLHAPGAAAEIVERVIATVDDEPILLSEVQARLLAALQAAQVDPSDTSAVLALRDDVREGIIEQRLLAKEAATRAIEVPEAEITQTVEDAILRNRQQLGSEARFQEQLQIEGVTEDDLRQRFALEARREILAARLVQSELRGRVTIAPGEARQYFDEHIAELPQREAVYKLQRIVWIAQPDSSALARTRALAADVMSQIRTGQTSFAAAARTWSDDPNGRDGGDLDRLESADLRDRLGESFEAQAFSLEPGVVSEPIRSQLGYHLLLVHEKDPQGQWIHMSHILFGVPVLRADFERARMDAQLVLARLRAGESFEELARRYSQTPDGAEGGGLGWVPLSAMDEPLQNAVQALLPGGVSDVIEVSGGFLVLRFLEREDPRPYTFEEIETELTDFVRARKMELLYADWIEGVKESHHIERRPWE